MDLVTISLILIALLFFFLGTGVWVAISLFGVALTAIVTMSNAPVGPALATTVWGASHSWELAALPMFIWMGEILFRSRLSEDMFSGLSVWMSRIPGRLAHVNILGCAIFAAVSGSSAATTVTIGKMTIPELTKRGYDEKLIIGTLAGSGTMGFLIPPSIILIVYGAATDQSIARLFIAGVIPGLVLLSVFMGYVVVWALLNSEKVPAEDISTTFVERIYATRRLIPIISLIIGVIGSIYMGLASPTEAAAVGVVLSLLLSWLSGTLNKQSFSQALMGATKTSCMIAFILAGATFLTVAMGFTGIPRQLAEWIAGLGLSHYELLAALTLFFIILGCFLDGISVVVLTTSVILPMVQRVGIDTIWFGIYIVLVVEMSQITPPVGFNLFVLQPLTGRNIFFIARCAIPFFMLLLLVIVLLTVFPQLALWLPNNMG
jgi:C4-dicarboxylate transporter, DctM subunit